MPKQVVATMDIMHNGDKYPMGKPVDPKRFTKEQLTRLYERGAVRIEDSYKEETVSEPTLDDVNREQEMQENADANISSVPAETLEPGAKKEAAAKGTETQVRETRGTTDAKGTDKK
jgi:hypothetical protein